MMIMKGENGGYWDMVRGVNLSSLDELVQDGDRYGRIVEVVQPADGRLEVLATHWVGPVIARMDYFRLLKMGHDRIDRGMRFSIGSFPVIVIDTPGMPGRDGAIIMRETNLIANIVVWLVYWMAHYTRDTDERLRWTARIWGLIPGRATVPEWRDLRPYQWLLRKVKR